MSAGRYALASKGSLQYAIEATSYTAESSGFEDFGVTNEDVEPPNENPQTAMPHGGHRRGPFVYGTDARDHEFDVPAIVHGPSAPLEIALGSRTESTVDVDGDGANDYRSHEFNEADRLPTATLRHVQEDLDMVGYYSGCKANLDLSWSQGDPLSMTMSIVAAALEYDETESAPSVSPTLDTTVSPFMAHMAGTVTMEDPGDGSLIKEVATVNGGDLSWDNGLEAQHHGGNAGRDAYSVAETAGAEKYEMSLDWNVTDTDLYERAYNNDAPVDVRIPFAREELNGTIIDGVIVTLEEAIVTDGPAPDPAEGILEGTVGLAPRNTTVEIREAI